MSLVAGIVFRANMPANHPHRRPREQVMTAIRGYVAPTTESDALGVHSLDQFVLQVPDANVAQDFYGNFGLDIVRDGNALAIKTFGHEHRWARWWKAKGPRRCIISRSAAMPTI